MAGLPPGDPQLVSMIVNHLKTQGLFDQFRRDCLADVDTKPAYLNLKQRVDNFVSNHLSNHTWSPHLNKNQLRNNIRQLVLQSGMLEQGVDRIVAQVVDPKINHIFRPQVERVVREFLSPGSCSEEPPLPLAPAEMKPDGIILEQASSSTPATSSARNVMSILDTITSLNQEASSRTTPSGDRGRKGQAAEELTGLSVEEGEQDMSLTEEGNDVDSDEKMPDEGEEAKLVSEFQVGDVKVEEAQEQMVSAKEGLMEEVQVEEETSGGQEQVDDDKDKAGSKNIGKHTEDKLEDEPLKASCPIKQKTRERLKEEYSLEDSDLDGLSDITVSSVHTSDLSSFEEESDEDQPPSDSSEDGELLSDAEGGERKQGSADTEDDKEHKPRRKAYVHKPFLYSRYYSDSDDEVTVEERRRSAAKDKEERLLKRQQNRERWEEKRRQKAALAEEQDARRLLRDSPNLEGPRAKEARKERKVLEKKMALKRKLDSRKEGNVPSKRKGDAGGENSKKGELKPSHSKASQAKSIRRTSESVLSDERHRKGGSISEDSSEPKKVSDKSRTHSFILELEQGSQESLKHRPFGKFDRIPRKEVHSKERKEKERLPDDRTKLKPKMEKRVESQADEIQQKEGVSVKVTSDEKGEKRPKVKSEKKMLGITRDSLADEGASRDATSKKSKTPAVEAAKADKEKDKLRDKDKEKVKEKNKVEKTVLGKSEAKPLIRPDSAGSSEDRSDMEPGPDCSKKREKHTKEVVKKVKGHTDDKQVEKPKSKSDTKDGEREKTKAELDSQKLSKANFETEKDPRKLKPTEKGKAIEKSKLKSKEEVKTAMLAKTDKKIQSLDGRGKGVATVVKHEQQTKEKKKEANSKENRRTPEDIPQDKLESRSAKKRLEKKDTISEKKESLKEKKPYREDKTDKSERSLTPSVSSPCPDSEEPPKKQALLQDASTDSEPTATTIVTSVSEDTYDALSDITPEPDDGEAELRLGELETRPMPPEADALLTLMDICTSADARLVHGACQEDAAPTVVAPKLTLIDADLKMKEAALTLLSMDPDSTLSPSIIPADSREDGEVNPPPPMDTTTLEKERPNVTEIVQIVADKRTTTLPPALSQEVDTPVTVKTDSRDVPDVVEREGYMPQVETSGPLAPEDDKTTSNEQQSQLAEEKAVESETVPVVQPADELVPLADVQGSDCLISENEETKDRDIEAIVSDPLSVAQAADTSCRHNEIQSDLAAVKTATEVDQMEDESIQAKMDAEDEDDKIDNISEDHNVTKREENVTQENSDAQNVECDAPDNPGEVRETRRSRQTKLIKQTSSASDSDRQEDEKESGLSEKEGRTEGRVTRKRKLPSMTKNSGEDGDTKDSQDEPSAEETEQEKVAEAKTPRRGRSSKTTTDEEEQHRGRSSKPTTDEDEQPKETEMSEEMPTRRGRRAGGLAKDTTDSQSPMVSQAQPGDEEEQSTENKTDHVKGDEQLQEEQEALQKKPGRRGRPSKGAAGVTTEDSGQSPMVSQAQPGDEEEQSTENKTDHVEGDEQLQEEQETAQKKPGRRGRPSKGAAGVATEDSADTKDKEKEQNDEEDDDETKSRTTRSAARLEAERNKPSKPSTRASKQGTKEESTRGARGQTAAVKGGRKREPSPPAVRTRGGQKSDEPPAKRANR